MRSESDYECYSFLIGHWSIAGHLQTVRQVSLTAGRRYQFKLLSEVFCSQTDHCEWPSEYSNRTILILRRKWIGPLADSKAYVIGNVIVHRGSVID